MKADSPEYSLIIPSNRNPGGHPSPKLSFDNGIWYGCFEAMASDCQILMEGCSELEAKQLLTISAEETWRIEYKYSRYQPGNLMSSINRAYESPLKLDQETCGLLNYADLCYDLSDGLFDISAGVLRKIWRFDGSDKLPNDAEITATLPYIGWKKVSWQAPYIQLKPGMELDLGGLGKEYAVDKVLNLLLKHLNEKGLVNIPILVNFGGDLACSGPRKQGQAWVVAVENHQREKHALLNVQLSQGAIATSGDSRRYLLKNGVRYSHILNPLNGRAIIDAPHAISVAAKTCMQAGMLATMAMLNGSDAEAFLAAQNADYWVQR